MGEQIRVLQVSKSTGGIGQYLRSLVYGLNKERFRVTVACLSEGSEQLAAEFSKVDKVDAFSLQMDRYKINLITDVRVWWSLARLVRRERFDVIHAHGSKPGFLARMSAVGTGIPTIYCPACFSFHDGVAKWKAVFYALIERVAAAWFTDRIIAVCNDEKLLARRYSVGKDTLFTVVYNGVNPTEFKRESDRTSVRKSLHIPEDVFLVGTVARLSKQKAPFDFVNAAAKVHKNFPEVQFVWVGDGELDTETKELIRSHNIENVFHLLGYRKDVPDLLNAMDCFVLASHWEGFSISVLEAMAAELPVIASRVSGAAEAVVDGETGLLVPIGDPMALARAIERLASNPSDAKRFGEAGRKRVEEKFTLNQMIREIETVYDEIVAGKNNN
jgi:glycosyltransferase involved in cell wall biosynthesis